MNKLSRFIVKHRFVILGVMLLLAIASVVAMMYVNVNSDILSYLPEGVTMTEGMDFMRENFDMQGDAIVGVSGVDYAQMEGIVEQISALEGLKPGGVIWIGAIYSMRNMDLQGSLEEMMSQQSSFIQAIMKPYVDKLSAISIPDMVDDMLSNPELLNIFYPNNDGAAFDTTAKADYMIMLQLNVAPSSNEAMGLLEEIDGNILKDYDHAVGGSTKMTKDIFDSTIGEIWKYLIVAILLMFLILLVTTDSLVEPFIFMITLGISILINMGTNIILPSVSVVTFAASSILQLGLSMDYAIFLMHAYSEERSHTLDDNLAMQRAIPKTFSTITASALTTVGGFLALFFMRFKIGADLGMVLAKGVFLSLLTVVFLQPCLMLFTKKMHAKTAHKIVIPKFTGLASFTIKHRKVIIAVAVLLLVPVIIMQGKVGLSYIKFTYDDAPKTEIEKTVDTLSNSLIIIVPVDDTDANYKFVNDVKGVDHVVASMGIFSMIGEDYKDLTEMLGLMSSPLGKLIEMPEDMAMMSSFVQNGYTMYSVMLNCEAESEEATAALAAVTGLLKDNFGEGQYYITGMAQAVEDLKAITPTDFSLVTIISILIILAVLIFTLRSFKLSAIIVAVIEFGIFVNLSLSFIFGETINFMAYIIISSIQLGATVDYAILYTVRFQRNMEIMSTKEAAYRALRDSGVSVLTSVAIMAGCCLSVSIVTTNRIVGEITMMIARGSIISGILVLLVLPALMVVFSGSKRLRLLKPKKEKRAKLPKMEDEKKIEA